MGIINLVDVCYTYRNKYQAIHAVKNITCSFEAGKLYAIVGKSGSGKTTLISLLAGLDLPTNGRVFYEGQTTHELDLNLYKRNIVSLIYQSYNLFPLLTILENVMYPLMLNKVPKNDSKIIAADTIRKVGLDENYHKRFPNMLSGGEQQRVAIARALVSNTKIILADEPTGNLDSENSLNIINILKNLAVIENKCIIVATHDDDFAANADVIIRMVGGQLVSGHTRNYV